MTSRDERQLLGIQKWITNKCKGTLMWCTGVGKTRGALIAINKFLAKNKGIIKIIVPTEYLKLQWIQELDKNKLLNNCSVEIINTAVKEYFNVDFLIIDEVHRIAADTFYDIFKKSTPKMVLGLSATFERLDGKHELLNKFCPICDIITIKEAITNKWLSPYKEYKVLIEVDDIEQYKEANAAFISSFSFFSFDFKVAMNCLTNIVYRRHYGKTMGASANEVDAQIFTWNRALKFRKQFVMNHPKKLEITRKILEARQDKKAITFSATIAQAEKIGNGFLIHSGNTKKKNRVSLEDFNDLKYGVLHTAKSLDEGADIKGLSLAIILCNTSSKTQKTQRVGRVIRYEEGKEAEIFTLVIKGTNEESWYNTSTAGKNYIEITEFELDDILSGNEIQSIEKEAKADDILFRF